MIRIALRATHVLLDVLVLAASVVLAYLLRYDWVLPFGDFKVGLFLGPYVVLAQYVLLSLFGIPQCSWRHFGLREVRRVAAALGVAMMLFLGARIVSGLLLPRWDYARYALMPIGVTIIDYVLAVLSVCGLRALRRSMADRAAIRPRMVQTKPRKKTLLVGAGNDGWLIARELENRPELGIDAIGFLDDDPHRQGRRVQGIPVLGKVDNLNTYASRFAVEQALITLVDPSGLVVRKVRRLCAEASIPAKVIPGLSDIVEGRVNLTRMRDVAIEDLLGREPVILEMEGISTTLKDKVVLVTGAGGSIGSELCRQILRFHPKRLILLERAEHALFDTHRDLIKLSPEHLDHVLPCIADVCDETRLHRIFEQHRPDIVFHAAAHKHVPMMEWNPGEAIKNNIFGTRTVADASDRFGVASFVMVSTDKAVNPTSLMGASKRVAEIYVQALDDRSRTSFSTVRFGNVLGSNGSVIPIFKEQIASGGPVTVTHPDMKRYFMTIPEACQLVLQAGAMSKGGEIFVLDMGEPVKILDLATDLISLSGFRPGEDIDIEFVGTRPGEKLFEELSADEEQVDNTRHSKILVCATRRNEIDWARRNIERLVQMADRATPHEMQLELTRVVPEYRSPAVDDEPASWVSKPINRTVSEAV
ncbi:MAG: nucleoside-diphosphate sugar epimerase/dehydratase [Myxococcota bacterium]